MSRIQNKRVFVAMSGGVDSSVAALLLKNEGYEATGVFMRCVSPSTGLRADCTTEVDATDARRVAEKLGIPFYVWDFEEEYKRRVVDYMIDGYRRGITPNPDVMCNREIKFGIFFERALAAGADYVATGHYVKLERDLKIENCKLKIAKDLAKDQSYFLWTLTQEKLVHCLFPIGDYLKSEVRELARKAGLPTAEKKDSQGICFLGKIALADFLKEYIPERSGAVITSNGEKIGEHRGAEFYTIGQRHLGIRDQASGIRGRHETKPHYVAEKNIRTNTLTVAEGQDNPSLYKKELTLTDVNLIDSQHSNILENVGISVWARVRYRQPLARATFYISNSRELENRENKSGRFVNSCENIARLVFNQPQKFVASGQSAVFYLPAGLSAEASAQVGASAQAGENPYLEMLGGGVIV